MREEDYKKAFEVAVKQRNEIRDQRDRLIEISEKFQIERDKARQMAVLYRDKYADIYGYPCPEFKLPWEDIYGLKKG